ncbi:hypothetical protein T02_6933 [Trichinella nativa]|uniref:Uncharacterized protein n=1 Tax=Trichinella nativa TaxID=6335 RepID=A0A0V1L2U9_9BILA|nr:hypothetical protein T06_11550 [Trichinella sp. T6]KRZ53876.1 hypothetical protein T02_6933 [Trichinella nativa]
MASLTLAKVERTMTKADRLLEKTRPKEAIILLTDAFWTLGTAAAMAKACSHWADARLGKAQKNGREVRGLLLVTDKPCQICNFQSRGLLVLHKWRQLEENEQNLHRIYSTMLERSTVQL